MKTRVLALLCPPLLLAGCGGSTPEPKPTELPTAAIECMPAHRPADEFIEVSRREVPQGGIVGLQIFYQGPERERLAYTAGVLMDMFEEAPVARGLVLASGGKASLFRRGEDRWILFWYANDACHQYTVGGDGFSRASFMSLLRRTGVLAEA